VRDNVIFELGLFIGRLGRDRNFIVVPSGQSEMHILTDLSGVTLLEYNPDHAGTNLRAALGSACYKIRTVVRKRMFRDKGAAMMAEDLRPKYKNVFEGIEAKAKDPSSSPQQQRVANLLLSERPSDLNQLGKMLGEPPFDKPEYYLTLAYQFWSLGAIDEAI